MTARVVFDRREVTITPPRPVPPKDQRAVLHRELDDALDELLAYDERPAVSQGPGRIADAEEGEP